MTYDSKKKCLMTIDGLENGNKPSEKLSDFRLPFGGGQGAKTEAVAPATFGVRRHRHQRKIANFSFQVSKSSATLSNRRHNSR